MKTTTTRIAALLLFAVITAVLAVPLVGSGPAVHALAGAQGRSQEGQPGAPQGEIVRAVSAPDGSANDWFGVAVAITGDTALIGAKQANVGAREGQGAVYVFARSGDSWVQGQKLLAADGTADDHFGAALALSADGNTVVIGAPKADIKGLQNQGAIYVFTRSGGTWSQQQKLVASDGLRGDNFGAAVALDGDTIVAGADLAMVSGHTDQGAAYVFKRAGGRWSQQQKLTAADGTTEEAVGVAVAVAGEMILVGAPSVDTRQHEDQGAVYVFGRNGDRWTVQQKLEAADRWAYEYFGSEIVIDGDTALIGSHMAWGDGKYAQGSVYAFVRNGSTWSQQQELFASDPTGDAYFGYALALDGNTAVIGAMRAPVDGQKDDGAAYIFTRQSGRWSEQEKLTANNNVARDHFGGAVDVDGETALIGAPLTDVGRAADQGVAHFYSFTPNVSPPRQMDNLVFVPQIRRN